MTTWEMNDGVRTNMVLVSKNLALAQFRCVECHKVFISDRHLEKHSLRRHGSPMFNFDQPDGFCSNDQKLIKVAERLENVLSRLELKTLIHNHESSPDACVVLHPSNELTEYIPRQFENCENIQVFSTPSSDARRPLSLFTLPNNRSTHVNGALVYKDVNSAFDEEHFTDNVLPEFTSKNVGVTVIGGQRLLSENLENIVMGIGEEKTIAKYGSEMIDQDINLESPRNGKVQNQTVGLEYLIIHLINKLEQAPVVTKHLESSYCQTSDAKEDVKDSCVISSAKKCVSFSDVCTFFGTEGSIEDEVIVGDEMGETLHCHNIQGPEGCDLEDFKAEDIIHNDCMKETTQIDSETEQYDTNSGIASVCAPMDDEIEQDVILKPQEAESECCEPQEEILHKTRRSSLESDSTQDADLVKFANTKQQILKIVEKCVKEIKSKKPEVVLKNDSLVENLMISTEKCALPPIINGETPKLYGKHEKVIGTQITESLNCSEKMSSMQTLCVRNENSQGFVPKVLPCATIFKDSGQDIDELSGNSYEQFMKIYSTRMQQNPKEDETKPLSYGTESPEHSISDVKRQSENSNSIHVPPSSSAQEVEHKSIKSIKSEQIPRTEVLASTEAELLGQNGSKTGMPHVAVPALKTAEYAVLLRDETSQVQTLIDTLTADLQRWRNAKRNEISKVIRAQLEEMLASNLNCLGIRSNQKSISGSQAASANLMLNRRRTKLVKSTWSYFDTLKSAFETEIDRIAKSRMT